APPLAVRSVAPRRASARRAAPIWRMPPVPPSRRFASAGSEDEGQRGDQPRDDGGRHLEGEASRLRVGFQPFGSGFFFLGANDLRSEEHTSELQSRENLGC